MNTLIIEPYGGLCNRMRAVMSSIVLAERLDADVHIRWNRNGELNCRFERLFTRPNRVSDIKEIATSRPILRVSRVLRRGLERIGVGRHNRTYIAENQICQEGKDPALDTKILTSGEVWISSSLMFGVGWDRQGILSPLPEFLNAAHVYSSRFRKNQVGVHIRGQDNTRAKANSSIQAFLCRLSREVEIDPEVGFFVASDEPVYEAGIMKKFGDRVSLHKKRSVDRGSPEAIEDALIDLLCLSGTRRILGSYWSSFSEMAAILGGTSCEVVRGCSKNPYAI